MYTACWLGWLVVLVVICLKSFPTRLSYLLWYIHILFNQYVHYHRLRCSITEKTQVNPVTGSIVKILSNDLKDLWKQFGAKIGPLVTQETSYGGNKADEKDVLALLKFYKDASKKV